MSSDAALSRAAPTANASARMTGAVRTGAPGMGSDTAPSRAALTTRGSAGVTTTGVAATTACGVAPGPGSLSLAPGICGHGEA